MRSRSAAANTRSVVVDADAHAAVVGDVDAAPGPAVLDGVIDQVDEDQRKAVGGDRDLQVRNVIEDNPDRPRRRNCGTRVVRGSDGMRE